MKTTQNETKSFGKYTEAVFDSGFRVMIMEKKNFSSAHAIFATKYGSIDTCFSTDGQNFQSVPEGIAHFLEHKLFESEEQDAFARFAKTGAYCNAYTSFDRTCYLFSCSERFLENLEILLSFVQSPYFTKETVEKEQGIIGQEIKMYEDSPNWRVLFNMLGQMYESHPIKIDIAGTVESIGRITDELLYKCYNTFYDLSNMCLCIAGNIDTDQTLETIKKNLKNDNGVRITRKHEPEPPVVKGHFVKQKLAVAGPIFCFGYKEIWDTPTRSQKDKLEADIMLELLCGECSPLYQKLMKAELINDEFSSEYFSGHDYSVVFFDGESRSPEEVANAIKAEVARLIEEGIDAELFKAVKKSAVGDRVRKFESLDRTVADMIEAAFYNDDIFATNEIIKNITEADVVNRLKGLKEELSVLSVVDGKE